MRASLGAEQVQRPQGVRVYGEMRRQCHRE